MNEGFAADAWIYTTLSQDPVIADSNAAGKIYKGVIPQGVSHPAIRYFVIRNETKQTLENRKVWHAITYQIEIIDKSTDYSEVIDVSNKIDELFDRRGHIGDVITVELGNVQYTYLFPRRIRWHGQ